jgi:hypothetical protein
MKKATINYFDTLTSVLQQGLLELHTTDNDKYNLFLSMAQFADTLGQKFLDLDPHHLTNIMDITINGILPTENEWFEFLDNAHVKQWKMVRTEVLMLIGANKSAQKLQSGQLNSNAEIQAARFLQDAAERYKKERNSVFNIKVPFPNLLGENPNGGNNNAE